MVKTRLTQGEQFYDQLDQEVVGQSSLGCSHIIVGLLILLLTATWLVWRVSRDFHWSSIQINRQQLEASIGKLRAQIASQSQVAEAKIILTDKQLNLLFKSLELIPNQKVKKISVTTDANELVLKGVLTRPPALPITLGYHPEITAGKINWRLTGAKLAGLPVPIRLAQPVDELVQPVLRQLDHALGGVTIEEVRLRAGELEVRGAKK